MTIKVLICCDGALRVKLVIPDYFPSVIIVKDQSCSFRKQTWIEVWDKQVFKLKVIMFTAYQPLMVFDDETH